MMVMQRQGSILAVVAIGMLAACATSVPQPVPAHAVVGVQQKQLAPEFWIARESNASRVVLDRGAIDAQNARLRKVDPSVHDLETMPDTMSGAGSTS